MTTSTECKSLYKKLYAIMSEIDFIEKDKENTHFNYSYASEYAIKTKVHEQLVKHGVLFLLETKAVIHTGNLATVEFLYHFVDMETGETLDGSFHGTGEDKNDKALWKAVTGAIKYILTSTFLIPTGDDPENDESDKKSAPANYYHQPAATPPSTEPVVETDWQEVVMHFGKNKGKKLKEIEPSYLNWLSRQEVKESASSQDISLRKALAQMIEETTNPLQYEDIKS